MTHRAAWRRVGRGGIPWYLACYVSTALAMLSKEYGPLLIVLMPLFDLLYRVDGGRWRAVPVRAVPIAGIGLGWLLVRRWLLVSDKVGSVSTSGFDLGRLGAYILELFLPIPFSFVSEAPLLAAGRWALPIAMLVVALGALVAGFGRFRAYIFPAVFALLPLLVVLTEEVSFRRRYLFLASIGAALLVALLIESLGTRALTFGTHRLAVGNLIGLALVAASLPAFLQRERIWLAAGRYAERMVQPLAKLAEDPAHRPAAGGRVKLFIPVLPYRFGGDDHSGVYVAQEDDLANLFELRCKLLAATRTWLWAIDVQELTYEVTYLTRTRIRVRIFQPSEIGMRSLIEGIEYLGTPATIDRQGHTIVVDLPVPGEDWQVVDLRDGQLRVVERPPR